MKYHIAFITLAGIALVPFQVADADKVPRNPRRTYLQRVENAETSKPATVIYTVSTAPRTSKSTTTTPTSTIATTTATSSVTTSNSSTSAEIVIFKKGNDTEEEAHDFPNGTTTARRFRPIDDLQRAWGDRFCQGDPERDIDFPAFPPLTKIRVECPKGYVYATKSSGDNDDRVITCNKRGQWNKLLGSCIRIGGICKKPVDLPEGVRIISQSAPISEDPNKFSKDSVINYECLTGYTLSSAFSRQICGSSGKWNPQNPPSCELVTTTLPPVFCRMPSIPVNGDIYIQSQPIIVENEMRFTPLSSITFKCDPEHFMIGNSRIRCSRSGRWNRRSPACKRAASPQHSRQHIDDGVCPRPETPSRGSVLLSHPTSQPAMYPAAGRIVYSCSRGFSMLGVNVITCKEDGQWDYSVPSCV